MERVATLLLCASLLAGCSALPESQGQQRASASQISQPVIAAAPEARQCLAQLDEAGARFTALPDRYTGQGCSTVGTVQMTALRSDASLLAVSNIGPLQCDVSNVFAAWARYGVDRAAQQLLGSPIARIETFGSYSCRNVAGTTRRSAHATAGAIDISGFVLADGRRISVEEDWSGGTSAEREFLRVIQSSACRRFDTVLGPDYNEAHRDHLHLEGVIDGNSFCR